MKKELEIEIKKEELENKLKESREDIKDEIMPGAYFYDVEKVNSLKEEIKQMQEEYDELEAFPTREKIEGEKKFLNNELEKINEELEIYIKGGVYFPNDEMIDLQNKRKEIVEKIAVKDGILEVINEIENTERDLKELEEEKDDYIGSYFIPDEITNDIQEKQEKLEKLYNKLDEYTEERKGKVFKRPKSERKEEAKKEQAGKEEQDRILLEEMVKGREKREQERYDETIKEAMGEEQEKILEEMVKGREEREQERYDETIKEAMEEEKRKQEQQEQEEQTWQEEQGDSHRQVKVSLEIFENKILIDGKDNNLFYKEEAKNKKELMEEYAIKSRFYKDKKNIKNIDWALLSTLNKIDDKENTLVMDYLSIIKGNALNDKSLEECMEELNKRVDIEYKFNVNEGRLLNRKEKKLARKANELGIASLSGISEKSIWGRMKDGIADKFKNRRFFKKSEKVEQLDSKSTRTRAEEQKKRAEDAINKDRDDYKKEEYDKLTNDDYMKSLDESFEKAKKEKMEQYKVNNEDNHIERNATKAQEKVEVVKSDAVIDKDGEEIRI